MKQGWEIRKLGELCENKPPKKEAKLKLEDNDLVSFLPMEDLGVFDRSINATKNRRLKDVAKSYTYFSNNDVLLAKITPCFENGKLGIARNLTNGIGFGSSEYVVFRPKSNLSEEYLFYNLLQDNFRDLGKKSMTGAVGHKRISKEFIEGFPIPLPPYPEQQRIVSILDKVFAAIEKVKANTEQNLKNANELFENAAQLIFTQKGIDWEERPLGELATFRNGINYTKGSKGEKIKVVGVKDFQNNYWVPDNNLVEVTLDRHSNDIDLLKEGDVLAVRSNGNPQLIGRTLLVGKIDSKVTHSGFTIRIRLNSKNIKTNYLCHFLKIQQTRKVLVESGNGVGIRSLNQGALSSLLIPFPKSLNKQQSIINKIDSISEHNEILKGLYYRKINDIEELKKSVLHKAFSGNLNVDYEDSQITSILNR